MADTMTQVSALKQAKQTMDTQLKQMNLTDIDELQDDLQELFEAHTEIQDLLSRSFATPEGLDEDELEAELMSLEAELDVDDLDENELPSYLTTTRDPLSELPTISQKAPGMVQPSTSTIRQV